MTKQTKWLLVILAVGLLLRLFRLDMGLLETSPNRQLIDAVYVRDIYRGRLISDQLLGFQLYHWIIAGLYHLSGGINEMWGKLLSVFFSLIGVIYFHRLSRLYVDKFTSLVAVFAYYVLSPMNIVMSRTFQVDSMVLALTNMALFYLSRWTSRGSRKDIWLTWLTFTLAMLTKLSYLYVGIPLAWLFYQRYRRHIFKQAVPYLFFVAVVIPVFSWYEFARQVNLRYSAVDGLIRDWSVESWFLLERIGQIKYYINLFYFWIQSVVTPVGAVVIPWVMSWRWPMGRRFILVWFMASFVYMIYTNNPSLTHEYYILAMVPSSTLLVGMGWAKIIARQQEKRQLVREWLVVISCVIAVLATWRIYALEIYKVPKKHQYVLATAEKVRQLIPKNEELITTSYNSGVLRYYSDRPGEYLVIINEPRGKRPNETIEKFEMLRLQGMSYYAMADVSELMRNPDFENYLNQFELLNPEDKDRFRIYKL